MSVDQTTQRTTAGQGSHPPGTVHRPQCTFLTTNRCRTASNSSIRKIDGAIQLQSLLAVRAGAVLLKRRFEVQINKSLILLQYSETTSCKRADRRRSTIDRFRCRPDCFCALRQLSIRFRSICSCTCRRPSGHVVPSPDRTSSGPTLSAMEICL